MFMGVLICFLKGVDLEKVGHQRKKKEKRKWNI